MRTHELREAGGGNGRRTLQKWATERTLERILATLREIKKLLATQGPSPAASLIITGHLNQKPFTPGDTPMADTNITLDQTFSATVTAKDRKGNPAEIADPVWASSDETVVSVVGNGLTAEVDTVGVGTARIVVSGDADLGDGVKPITGEMNFIVAKGGAVTLEITGTVVDKA